MIDPKFIKHFTPNNQKTLFCFPYAGGGASVFNSWAKDMDNINICPIQLPGREERIMEKPYTYMKKLVGDIADTLEPYISSDKSYFFGHSMGGKIAYETAMELHKRGKDIHHIFVSGCEAPHIPIKNPIYDLPDSQFVKEIISFDGTPKELYENRDLLNFFLPLLRGDFTLVETYRAKECHPLSCPMTAFYGTDDSEASQEDVKEWEKYTDDAFNIKEFNGGHFFIKSQYPQVSRNILKTMNVI